jgi:chemotaxis signal transduction protein
MVNADIVHHMPAVAEYRARLASLQGSWDTLSLLSHLRGGGADMTGTRHAFETLTGELIQSLGEETYRKSLQALKARSQIAIDVIVRNLYERTADIGFLAIDSDIREYLRRVTTLAADPGAKDSLDDALRQRLREYVAKYSVYHDVILLDTSGNVLLRLDARQQVRHTDHPLLQQALTTRQSYVETFDGIDLLPAEKRSLVYSFRIGDNSRPEGVLCLCFRLEDEVASIFAKLRSPEDWTVFCFLDERGTVIASSDTWQAPLGAVLPLALDEGGRVVRFAGRQYLASTRSTQGYQGYRGPGWYGHAMLPIEHAFDHQAVQSGLIPDELLASLADSEAIFSESLRRIPERANAIQNELHRTVWNGNVSLADSDSASTDFTKVLLREIGNSGRRTQETFERSIGDLQKTVVAAILDDAQLFASLAVDVLDRNLYERANDCRWWALNGELIQQLSGVVASTGRDAGSILRHINSLYTVYHDIVLFDADRRVVAVSNPRNAGKVGRNIAESWAAQILQLRDAQHHAVSAFAPCEFYEGRHTLVYGAAIRDGARRVIGGIGIVFDSAPQFGAMLRDSLPHTESGEIGAGCIGLFVDDTMRVIAATSNFQTGDLLDLPRELLAAGGDTGRVTRIGGTCYALGTRSTSGYREYAGMGVSSIILIPLGEPDSLAGTPRRDRPQAMQKRAAGREPSVDIATFYCGALQIGLLRSEAVEAIDGARLHQLPGAASWHAGVLVYRDKPLPVIDLGRLLDIPPCGRPRNVIVAGDVDKDDELIGLLVDELADNPEIAASRIVPMDAPGVRDGAAILDRAVQPERSDEPVLMLLNVSELFARARVARPDAPGQRRSAA